MSIADYAKDIWKNPSKYRKFWVAFIGFIITLLSTSFPDTTWLPAVVSFVTALGVFQAKNDKI